jgi:hypothetical protein
MVTAIDNAFGIYIEVGAIEYHILSDLLMALLDSELRQ